MELLRNLFGRAKNRAKDPLEGEEPLLLGSGEVEEEDGREEVLEGEYRDLSSGSEEAEPAGAVPSGSNDAARRRRRRLLEEEIEEAKRAQEQEKLEMKEAKRQRELLEASNRAYLRAKGEAKWQRFERTAGHAGKVLGVAHKGVHGLVGVPKAQRDKMAGMVIPRAAQKGLYVPPTPTIPKGQIPAGAAHALDFGHLRQATALKPLGATPLAQHMIPTQQLVQETPVMARMREMTIPRGLTRPERLAYTEIVQNGDVDVPSHVVEELSKLGISKAESEKAIRNLLRRGNVVQTDKVGGERVLEIIR